MKNTLGILITNTGTPDSPAIADIKSYLKAFLSDPRVVRLPKILWQPLLNAVILPRRAAYSAALYAKIWTSQGSPLRTSTLALAAALEKTLAEQLSYPVHVEAGMHYGSPSIPEALEKLRAKNPSQLVVLPLFPQYSTSTTESTRDRVEASLKSTDLPYSLISYYFEHPQYIDALARQIQKHHSADRHLLFSFHGLPQYFVNQGDPYAEHCQRTAELVAAKLGLADGSWSLSYQSRLGYAKWLSPYTAETLKDLPKNGWRALSVVCPGFAVDCLETLEEIQLRGKELFLENGGLAFQYIPALNTEEMHVAMLAGIIAAAHT